MFAVGAYPVESLHMRNIDLIRYYKRPAGSRFVFAASPTSKRKQQSGNNAV